jgi:hydroxymethylpyrimidine pyrophosphatase-like HAD family hydrolase
MKLSAIALDYDGTIAVHDQMDPSVHTAVGEVRDAGIAVILVTGRRLDDLRRVAGDLACFDVIVAENGAVVDFQQGGRHVVLGHAPHPEFIAELTRRGIACEVGEALVEADASTSPVLIETIHALELPLALTFNRGRVMALPQAVGKSTGLRHALTTLRLSIHNTIGIGDAENDYDLLEACEVGVAVEWGSRTLQAAADHVIRGTGPVAVADYLRQLAQRGELTPYQMGRRRIVLGQRHDGTPVTLSVRGRPVLVAGEPGTGKSWIAGLMAEQLILQGYCVCVIDPEGDYASLEALPGVILLGGDDPPPNARELTRTLRYPDVSVVVELSKLALHDKAEYLETVMELLLSLRRQTGLPHRIIVDEAHYLIAGRPSWTRDPAELRGQTLVTYRVSALTDTVALPDDAVVIVTREGDPHEIETLRGLCRPAGAPLLANVLRDLPVNEAVILPGPDESIGCVARFEIAPRLTAHVRHRTKYLDMPVNESQAFVFTANGRPVARAHTLKEFAGFLMTLPEAVVEGHLRRHDFSHWIDSVFRDGVLGLRVRTLEGTVDSEAVPDIVLNVDQTIRARYERVQNDIGDRAEARSH